MNDLKFTTAGDYMKMNGRIEELAEQANLKLDELPDDTFIPLEKFAELIVRECVDRVTTKANVWGDMTGFAIKESILDCANDLKQHFGVER